MLYADELKALTVRIGGKDGGSGVIVKPMDDSILYILTAWHCISECGTVKGDCLCFDASIKTAKEVTVKDVYHDEDTDAAIIVVNRFCDDVGFVCFEDKTNCMASSYHHTGFPSCREEEGERNYSDRVIDKILNDVDNLVEYTYAKVPQKEELKGMSGGGIFDESFHLLGVHKRSSCEDSKEQLGYARFIPCRHFDALIKKHSLPQIGTVDISSFRPINSEIFNFDHNKGAKADLERLLGDFSIIKIGLLDKSPMVLFETFQNKRKCRKKVLPVCLKKEDWARFAEFLLACKLMKGEEVGDFNVDIIVKHFQYIYSEKEFDLFDVRAELNAELLGRFHGVDCVYVIGGITSKGENYDVKNRQNIPDLSIAAYSDEFDIADADNSFLCNLTFVNSHLFRDMMESKGAEIKDANGEAMELYKSLLEKRIYG